MGDERDQSRKRGQQLGGRDGGSLWIAHGDVCSTPVLLSLWTLPQLPDCSLDLSFPICTARLIL